MFLREKDSSNLVEILGLDDLFNPMRPSVFGRFHVGEELPDPQAFDKKALCFCSGEPLPRCWMDVHYRDHELRRVGAAA